MVNYHNVTIGGRRRMVAFPGDKLTREEIVLYVQQPVFNVALGVETPIACAMIGTISKDLWVVWEHEDNPGRLARPPQRYLVGYRFYFSDVYKWGYVVEAEISHPIAQDCPLVLLDLADSNQNEAWRQGVRAFHALG